MLKEIAPSNEINPSSATKRAFVDENKAIPSTNVIGLTMYKGNEPGPPGFPSRARFGPPPAIRNPESIKNRFG